MWMNSNRSESGVFAASFRVLGLSLGLLLAGPATLLARSLHWPSMDVIAKLEADGDLRVTEVLVYEFDGDWNGGERSLDLRSGQSVTVHGITRIDPATGTRTTLAYGSLDEVDNWLETSTGVLRWRSRLPSDPSFDKRSITYEIDYTYRGAVVRDGDQLRIAHDFAFPNRPGSIDRFTLTLDVDPAWQVAFLTPLKREAENLRPGDGLVVALELTYAGDLESLHTVNPAQIANSASGEPVMLTAPRPTRWLILQVLIGASILLVVLFLGRETFLGRFEPVDSTPVDRAWLEREIFAHKPEVIGAAWDESVSNSEVAATLMRLQSEGKIEATFGAESGGSPSFSMRRLRPISSFEGYEKALLEGYFFSGDTVTNTELKSHYLASGFNPVPLIQTEVLAKVSELFGDPPRKTIMGWLGCPLFLAGPGLVVAGLWHSELKLPGLFLSVFSILFLSIFSSVLGSQFAKRVDRGMFFLVSLGTLSGIAVGVAAWMVWRAMFPALTLWGIAAAGIFPLFSFLSTARTTRGRKAMEGRKRLVRARKHIERELSEANPALDDAWYPWIVAFGLETNVTKWADSFGGQGSGIDHHHSRSRSFDSSSSSSSGFSNSSGSSWSGGGGAFGGAGASGAWAAAATSIASPSSSSSDGSSGGGGSSSSGGGGGGGW